MSTPLILADPDHLNRFIVHTTCNTCKKGMSINTTDPAKYLKAGLLFLCASCTNTSRMSVTYSLSGTETEEVPDEPDTDNTPRCECGSEKAGTPGHSSWCPRSKG